MRRGRRAQRGLWTSRLTRGRRTGGAGGRGSVPPRKMIGPHSQAGAASATLGATAPHDRLDRCHRHHPDVVEWAPHSFGRPPSLSPHPPAPSPLAPLRKGVGIMCSRVTATTAVGAAWWLGSAAAWPRPLPPWHGREGGGGCSGRDGDMGGVLRGGWRRRGGGAGGSARVGAPPPFSLFLATMTLGRSPVPPRHRRPLLTRPSSQGWYSAGVCGLWTWGRKAAATAAGGGGGEG